jgi:phage pi2 protein 07
MPAFLLDHPEQRRSRDRFRIQNQGLISYPESSGRGAEWALKQVQGDEI